MAAWGPWSTAILDEASEARTASGACSAMMPRDLERARLLPAGRHDLLHEAQPQRLGAAELVAGEQVALGIAPAGALHHAHAWRRPPA